MIDEKTNTEKIKFANGPANTVENLPISGASLNSAELEGSELALTRVFIEAKLSSSENLTNPPRGIIANCHSVPFLSLKDNILGPNPILKTETSILLRRAITKCPNSCTKITIPNAQTIDKNCKIKMRSS
jgi:hypothetical protein